MEFTTEQREVIIQALMLMEVDNDTTAEGKKLINEVLALFGVM